MCACGRVGICRGTFWHSAVRGHSVGLRGQGVYTRYMLRARARVCVCRGLWGYAMVCRIVCYMVCCGLCNLMVRLCCVLCGLMVYGGLCSVCYGLCNMQDVLCYALDVMQCYCNNCLILWYKVLRVDRGYRGFDFRKVVPLPGGWPGIPPLHANGIFHLRKSCLRSIISVAATAPTTLTDKESIE